MRDFPLALPTMTVLTPQVGVAILPVVKSIYLNDIDTGKVTRGAWAAIQTNVTISPDRHRPHSDHRPVASWPLGTCSNAPELPNPAAKHPASSSSQAGSPGARGGQCGQRQVTGLLQSHSLPSSKDPGLGTGRHLDMGAQPRFHRGDGAGFLDADC